MNNETKTLADEIAAQEIEEKEMQAIAGTMQVRSGVRAGKPTFIVPCV